MKHRKQTQHIRRYRSGRWIAINKGIKYSQMSYEERIRNVRLEELEIKRLEKEIAKRKENIKYWLESPLP